MMVQTSGLSAVLGDSLSVFGELPAPMIVLIMVLIGTLFTTFTSNVSTTTILLPITSELVSQLSLISGNNNNNKKTERDYEITF